MCLKNMIQSNLALNFSDIFEKISPIIISLFNQFNSADTIWNLIQLFILFLQNLQDKAVDYLETIIRSTNLDKLLETDQEILIQIMHDMLRHLIVAFPVNSSIPYIYSACLKFIAIQMKVPPPHTHALAHALAYPPRHTLICICVCTHAGASTSSRALA